MVNWWNINPLVMTPFWHIYRVIHKSLQEGIVNCFVCRWFCVVHDPKPPLHSYNWLSFGKFQDTGRFLINCERHFSSRLPPSGGTWKYAKAPSTKKTWRDSLPIDMLLSAVSVLVVGSRVRKSQRDLWITPFFVGENYNQQPAAGVSATRCNTCSLLLCSALSEQKWVNQLVLTEELQEKLIDMQTDGHAATRFNTELRQSISCGGITHKLIAAGIGLDTLFQYCTTWHTLSPLCHLSLDVTKVPIDTRCQHCATWHSRSVLYNLTLAVNTVPLDTSCQHCATWHSLSVLCNLTLAVSTVSLDTRCQNCATWHSLSALCHLTLAVSTVKLDTSCQHCATWHSLSVLCNLTLAVSTVSLDTRCQHCATWHSLSALCHLTLAVSTVHLDTRCQYCAT